MSRFTRRTGRAGLLLASLAGAFIIALTAPIPSLPDAGLADVRAEVGDRLPGWTVHRIHKSWEGAYAVVTTCGDREVAFQFVPGHGLPHEDAWLQPNNDYARRHLAVTSDHRRYLLWQDNPEEASALSCSEEVASNADINRPDPRAD
jgi:hypothetical protein